MKKETETGLFILGIIILLITAIVSVICPDKTKTVLESLAIVTGLIFFIYKLFAGWLFINLNLTAEPERESAGNDTDYLIFKITLSKGDIDSAWIKDIQIRVMQVEMKDGVAKYNEMSVVKDTIGMKKREEATNKEERNHYWTRKELDHYVLSPNEEAKFSAFTLVPAGTIIAADILVPGTRPFYAVGINFFKRPEQIQWKSSIIILPKKTAPYCERCLLTTQTKQAK